MKLPKVIHKSDLKKMVCPFAADQYFNQGAVQVETKPMRNGTDAHEILYRWRLKNNEFGASEAALEEAAQKNEDVELFVRNGISEEAIDTTNYDMKIFDLLKFEKKITVSADGEWLPNEDYPDAAFCGTIDAIYVFYNGKVIIEDLKTGYLRAVDKNEVAMYTMLACAYFDGFGVDYDRNQVSFEYFWLRYNERDIIPVSVAEIDRIPQRLCAARDFYESMEPSPIPGHHCSFCQFAGDICPLGNAIMQRTLLASKGMDLFLHGGVRGIMPPEQEAAVAQGILHMQELTKKAEKLLLEYLERSGKDSISCATAASFIEAHAPTAGYGQKAALNFLRDLPFDELAKVVGVTATGLKALEKLGYSELAGQISAFCVEEKTPTPTLGNRRVK